MSPARLVFVDEMGAVINLARRYGRSLCGLRLDGPVPHGHWKSTTFVGGLATRGFVAPCVLDAPMNGTVFKAWAEHMLAPRLAARKVAGIREAIETQGMELRYLPPYSPRTSIHDPAAAGSSDPWKGPVQQGPEASRPSPSSRQSCARWPSAPSTAGETRSTGGEQFEQPTKGANYLANSDCPRSA